MQSVKHFSCFVLKLCVKGMNIFQIIKVFLQVNSVIVLGAFGGRLDQIFANIETLFTAKNILPGKPVYLFSQESVACLLSEVSV